MITVSVYNNRNTPSLSAPMKAIAECWEILDRNLKDFVSIESLRDLERAGEAG